MYVAARLAAGFAAAFFAPARRAAGFVAAAFFAAAFLFTGFFFMERTLQAPRNVVNGGMRIVAAALVLLAGLALPPAPPVRAQALDAASREALGATLRMLQDPALRGAAISGSPQAGAADGQLQSLGGSPQLTQELYGLAAEVFADLARGTGGDVQKMSEALERGRTDPAGFAAMLSPATLQKLRELSVKVSDRPR